MDRIIMRERKSAFIIGIICMLFFTALGLLFSVMEGCFAMLVFLPFTLLGGLIILIYCRHYIILETSQMIVSEPFRKKRIIRYAEIHTVMIHTTNVNTEIILLDHQKERLLKFAMDMTNADKAVEILDEREIPCVDLSGLVENEQSIKEYLPVLTKWEQFIYRPQIRMMENTKKVKASNKTRKIEKEKRFVRIMGWIMIGMDLFAFIVLRGKPAYVCFVFVLLLAWGMYIWMYPNLFLEPSPTGKFRKYIIEMPFLGIAAAALFCMITLKIFNFSFSKYLAFMGIYAVILLLPFMLKLYLIREKPDKTRLLMTVLAVLTLAFITALPINYLTTFGSDGHESIIVKDKRISSGKTTYYYIYADWREEDQEFSVSGSEYKEIRKGDHLRVCLRHSIFGFHYWTVHK